MDHRQLGGPEPGRRQEAGLGVSGVGDQRYMWCEGVGTTWGMNPRRNQEVELTCCQRQTEQFKTQSADYLQNWPRRKTHSGLTGGPGLSLSLERAGLTRGWG